MLLLLLWLGLFAGPVWAQADPAVPAADDPPESRPCRIAADLPKPGRRDLARCDRAISQPGLSLSVRLAMLMNRGLAWLKAARPDRAAADFDLAIKAAPGLPEAWINKGVALSRIDGRANEAIALISHGIDIGPRRPAQAYFARAQAHELVGNLRAAMDDYAAAARADPDWPAPAEELKRFRVERRKVLRG